MGAGTLTAAATNWADAPEAETDDKLIESVAIKLSAIHRKSGFDRTCEIGKTILTTFYDDSEEQWSARARGKLVSIRKLARRLRGVVQATELHRSVHVWIIYRAMPFITASNHLTVSHVDAVLGLPKERQVELLRRSEAERLSVRELRSLRRRAKIASGEMRGRPPSPMVVKATTRVRNALALLKSAENALQAADFSSDPMPREIVEVIEQVRDQVASLLTLAAARERPSGIHPKILGLAKSTSSAAQRVRSAG